MASSKTKAKKEVAPKAEVVAATISFQDIAAAGESGIYTSAEVHMPLIEQGLVEINPALVDESGFVATRVTQKGLDSLNEQAHDTNVHAASAIVSHELQNDEVAKIPQPAQKVKTMFKIDEGVPVPHISGRGRTGTQYPFDQLEVGQSFFVPNDESKPNAAKSLASTVSSATARFAVPDESGATKLNKNGETVPVMVETRKFVVRAVTENGISGARVWRAK
jgi:hypothetical protein